MEADWLRSRLESGRSIESIAREAGKAASTVAYWVNKHGLVSAHAPRHAARGPLDPDELRDLVEQGLSIRQIAARVDRSPATVRHWLGRYGLQTRPPATRCAMLTSRRAWCASARFTVGSSSSGSVRWVGIAAHAAMVRR